ncbi:transmembrane protein [Kwoniella heveanensis CBS 569]|nr:transmembrane protein [Kwoniella heveanensis CBS 569]
MATLKAVDHAVPDGNPAVAIEAGAGLPVGNGAAPGIMTDDEKIAVAQVAAGDQEKGGKVHLFNPDASAEEKAAAKASAKAQLGLPSSTQIKQTLGQVGSYVPGMPKQDKVETGARAVVIDTSSGRAAPVPTVSLADVDKASRAEGQGAGQDDMPGAIPTGAAPPVPTWVQTGWRQVAGLGKDERSEEQASILTAYLSENMYGAWFHNAGIILFAVLMTRTLTVLHLGWGWISIVLAFCSSYYSLSISRTRQRARDDIQRELVKTRLVTETESADWMNSFLERFWLIYEPVLSQTIIASTDAALAGVAPAGVDSIKLTTFTSPRIDYVRTFPKTPEDIVIMDWALSFTPNDLQDITPRQAAKRVNPKIVLTIRVGKGAVSKGIPILLEDMSFTGKMRIKLKLMTNFPHIQTVDMSFIEKPTFDYVLKPLGGDTFGFDINNIPGLAPFIREQVHANLGPMMYDPNVFTIDLQQLLSGTPLDAAIGVLRVTILDARGLKATKFGGGEPDPYVSVALGAKPPITETKTVHNTSNPSWHETQFILINSLADVLNLNLYDYNDHRPDSLLGTVSHELGSLSDDAEQEGVVGKILGGGKERGELRYDLSYFPVLKPEKNPDGTVEPLPDTQTGIVRLTLHQAKDLDISRMFGDLNPFAKVYLGSSRKEVHKTKVLKHANQPIWEESCEFLVPEKKNSVVTIQITDSKDLAVDSNLGSVTVRLTDLLEARARQQDWFPLKGSRAGKIRLTAEWKPVAMTGSIGGASAYVPPIGILRVWLKRAVDVKNVEAALGGKSDPYVRVMGNNRILARTEVQNNNLNPEWDQIVYVPVHSTKENIILELMDYQNIGKDRSLGYVEVKVSDFIEPSDSPHYPYRSTGAQQRKDRIKLDKANQYKGEMLYEVDFKPAVSFKGGVSFEAQKNELTMAAEEAQSQADGYEASIVTDANGSTNIAPASPASSRFPNNGTVNGSRPSGSLGHRPSTSIGNTSIMSAVTAQSQLSRADSAVEPLTPVEDVEQGVEMTIEEILACQSGVLVFQIISGRLARRGRLEVLIDDVYWPSFTTGKARSLHPTWDQVGEGFIRELDFSRTWLRINEGDESDHDDIVAEAKLDTRDFLEQCITGPAEFALKLPDESNRSTVTMSARFVPVDIVLEPRESMNNMGILKVDVLNAKGLHGADRSGKSDPYVMFTLNGNRVFKSETKKKTLAPEWNEKFEVMIPSRVAASFRFEICDWDRVGSATPIGSGSIDLTTLEPLEQTELTLPVKNEKHGEKGSFTIRVLFQPEIIARSRQKTSTFSTAGRAITQIGGVPIGVGKGVIHGGTTVGKGVFHGGTTVVSGVGHGIGSVGGFAGRRVGLIKKKDKSGKEIFVEQPESPAGLGYEIPAGQVSEPAGAGMDGVVPGAGVPGPNATTLPIGEGSAPTEPGTLGITVLAAKDLKAGTKPYVQVKLGGKSHKTDHVKSATPEWNENFKFNVAPGVTTFTVTVFDHHTLGKDIELGEAEVDIFRHIRPAVPNADVWVELSGAESAGLLRLRLDWNDSSTPNGSSFAAAGNGPATTPSKARVRTASIASSKAADSPSKFSIKGLKKSNGGGGE